MPTIGVDLGGSHIKIGLVEQGTVLASSVLLAFASHGLARRLPYIEAEIANLCEQVGIAAEACDGVGVGFPATVDHRTGRVVDEYGKFSDAIHLDLSAWAEAQWGIPLVLESDSRLATLGEWKFGSGKGHNDLVTVFLGSGIGTSAVMEGRIVRGYAGQAGILGGHQTVNIHGDPCICGNVGCVEHEASLARAVSEAKTWPSYSQSVLSFADAINHETLFEAVRNGDEVAAAIADKIIKHWAAVAVHMIHAYDPQLVVLGGGIMGSSDIILPSICEYIHQYSCTPAGRKVDVVTSQLGSDAALAGADWLVQQQICDKNSFSV